MIAHLGAPIDTAEVYNAQHVYDPVADPEGWRSRDVSGILSPRPSVQKLMFALGKGAPWEREVNGEAARSSERRSLGKAGPSALESRASGGVSSGRLEVDGGGGRPEARSPKPKVGLTLS